MLDSVQILGYSPAMTYDPKHTFQNLARHNERVNREMYDVLSQLTGRARRREVGSWFGSMHSLLNHIIICDINWLKRYRPLSPESTVLTDPGLDPPNLAWDRDLHDGFTSLRDNRAYVDERIRAWFAEFPVSRYSEIFQYHDSAGNPRKAMAGEAFEFLFLHQTHHRGQISQILDNCGWPNNFADNGAYLEG